VWSRFLSLCAIPATLALAVALSVGIRLTNVDTWNNHPEKAFMHDGRPVLIEPDGYLYLRYARDLSERTYTPEDSLRYYPSGGSRPVVPPLLSGVQILRGG